MKRLLIIAALLLFLLVLAVAGTWWWLTTTRGGAQWALSQVDRFVDTLEWSTLEGGFAGGVVINDLQLRHQGTHFDAARVELSVRVRALPRPSVRVYWLRGRDMVLVLPAGDDQAPEPLTLPDDLSSPVPVRIDELQLHDLTIRDAETAAACADDTLPAQPQADPCGITIDHLGLAAQLDQHLVVERLRAQALGWVLDGDIDAGLQAPWPLTTTLQVSGQVLGQQQRTALEVRGQLDQLELNLETAGVLDATLAGQVSDLPESPALDAEIHSPQLAWPEIPATISDLVVRVGGTPNAWRLSSTFDAEAVLEAAETTTRIPSRWQLEAAGDLTQATLSEARVELLDGEITLAGNVQWAGTLAAEADVHFRAIDFTAIYPEWPDQAPVTGHLAGRYSDQLIEITALELTAPPSPLMITGSGYIDAEADHVTADIQWRELAWPPVLDGDRAPLFVSRRGSLHADGSLSDWRVELQALLRAEQMPEGTLDATVTGDQTSVIIDDLELNIRDNRLHASSTPERRIDYRLDAANLEQLWPGLGGSLQLAGHVALDGPAWSVSGSGANLAWQQYRLASLTLESQGSLAAGASQLDTHLQLETLELRPWERIDRLELTTEGRCEDHRIVLETDATQAGLRLAGSAGMDACPPDFGSWQVRWTQLELLDTLVGDWSMPEVVEHDPAGTRVTAGGDFMLENLCLISADDEHARLCLPQFELSAGGGAATAHLARIPANLILGLSDLGIRLSSRLDGEFDARWHGNELEHLSGELEVTRGWLRQQGTTAALRIDSGHLRLHEAGANNLHAELLIEVEGDSRIEANAELTALQPADQAQIVATAQVRIPGLSAYGRLVPELDRFDGRLDADFALSGAMLSPDLSGQLQLHDGHVQSVPLGLDLSAIELVAQTANRGLSLAGGFNAGDGRAELTGQITPQDGEWQVSSHLRGDNLQLFDADWLRLRISPDFTLDLSGERIDIGGRIDIPHARLGLPPGSAQRVPTSADVVILNHSEPEPDRTPPIPLYGDLTIGIGDDVRFQGAGAQADIAGEVQLQWRDGAHMPRGRGTLHLTGGHYHAYGQNLNFTDSEVQFAARPVDDPVLDIRAVREIFADPVVEAAGVHIRGTARNPIIELFTDPPTNEEKALAYIVTGADFDHAAGQGAFNIGFYLMPRLFVSYGIGLFETGNVLSASYQLSRRWGLRATSGERDTGVDFSYSVER